MTAARGLLLGLVAAALLVACALIAVVTLDLGPLSRPLTAWVSQQISRTLTIDGPVSIRAGRTLSFNAESVRLANTAWGSRSDMLAIRRLTVEVDTWSLIQRPVIVRRVAVEGLDLLLERRADGANNWEFGPETSDEPFKWPESLSVVVERVSLPGARLMFIGPRFERPLQFQFDSLEQSRGEAGMLDLVGQGLANETTLKLDAHAGPFAHLIEGRDFTMSLDTRLGDLALEGRLQVDDIARPINTSLSLRVRGPDSDYLASRFGMRNLGSGPLALDGVVRPAATGGGIEGELTGSIGQFTVKARGELAEPTEMAKASLQLEIAGPDLSFVGGLAGVERLPAEAFQLTAAVDRTGDVLKIGNATLALADSRAEFSGTIADLHAMTGNDLRFRFQGSDLGRFRSALTLPESLKGAFDITGKIRGDNAGEHIELRATTTLGTLKAAGALGRYPGYYGTRVRLDASGPNLARVGQLAGISRLPGTDFAAGGDLEWTEAGAVIRKGTLRAGRNQLGLDGRIARDAPGPGTDVTWNARGPDLRQLVASFGVADAPAGAFDLRGRLRREPKASRLDQVQGTVAGAAVTLSGRIADAPLRGTDVQFSVAGPRLEAFAGLVPDYPWSKGKFSVSGGLALTEKHVTLGKVRIAAAGAEGSADADIELPLSAARGRFDVTAKGDNIARFLPALGTQPRGSGPFDLQLRGAVDGGSWRFDDARLTANVGSITGSGKLDWAPDFSATALNVAIRAPDLSAVGRLFATELPAKPFELTAEFTGTPTAFKVDRASGRLGTSDFDGRMQIDLQARPVVDLDFRSDLLDLTPFMDEPASASAPTPAPARRQQDKRVIPDSAIPLAWLDRVDGSLAIRATRAVIASVAMDDLRLAARLSGGRFTLDSLQLKAPPDGGLTANGAMARGAHGAAIRLSATGTRVSLARLEDSPAIKAARPRAEIQLELAGEGATWQEWAQSLGGKVRVTTGPGAVPAATGKLLFGNVIRDIATMLLPGVKLSDSARVRCMAAFLTVADGIISTAPALVMQTERINLASHGSADLRTEKVAFYLRTAPRRGRVDVTMGEIVTPYLMVNGTLANPGVSVDTKGALFSGGAAFATAGISILAKGVWDRMFQADDPCKAAGVEADRLEQQAAQPQKKSLLQKIRGR